VFRNGCDRQVNVMLCVHVSGQSLAYYLLLVGNHAEARQRLEQMNGRKFEYKYNACDRPYCTPPNSQC
jgi:hypothetical protein